MLSNYSAVTTRMIMKKVNGYKNRGRLKNIWMICVRNDIGIIDVNTQIIVTKKDWKSKTCCVDLTWEE